jgi:uncharacterized protein with GYD domain
MANQTFIILCDFAQDDLATLSEGGPELQARAASLHDERNSDKDIEVRRIYLTHGLNHDAVVVVEAPNEDRAREALVLFEDIGDVDARVLTVTDDVPDNILKAFNGHTKM